MAINMYYNASLTRAAASATHQITFSGLHSFALNATALIMCCSLVDDDGDDDGDDDNGHTIVVVFVGIVIL